MTRKEDLGCGLEWLLQFLTAKEAKEAKGRERRLGLLFHLGTTESTEYTEGLPPTPEEATADKWVDYSGLGFRGAPRGMRVYLRLIKQKDSI